MNEGYSTQIERARHQLWTAYNLLETFTDAFVLANEGERMHANANRHEEAIALTEAISGMIDAAHEALGDVTRQMLRE